MVVKDWFKTCVLQYSMGYLRMAVCVANVLSITWGLQGGNVLSELDFVCTLLKDYWVHSPPPHVKNFNRRWHLWWSRVCLKPISCNVAWGIVVVCVYCKCAHRYVWVTGWGIASVRCRWQPSSREAQSTHGEVRPDVQSPHFFAIFSSGHLCRWARHCPKQCISTKYRRMCGGCSFYHTCIARDLI